MTRITGTLHEDKHTFFYYLAEFFLELEIFQTKLLRENQNTHFMFNSFSFRTVRLL